MPSLFRLNPSDPLPLYAQLERAIRLAVATGSLRSGHQLPTVRQLAVDLKINSNTVAKVYAELERQGLLATRRGVGTFIQENAATPTVAASKKRAEELSALAERFLGEATAYGFSPDQLLQQMQRHCSKSKEKSHGRT